jgi:hypothetical protein
MAAPAPAGADVPPESAPASLPATATATGAPGPASAPATSAPDDEHGKKKKKGGALETMKLVAVDGAPLGPGTFEVHGRAILRAELRSEDSDPLMPGEEPATLDLSLASARLELRYAIADWLRIQVEGEIASGSGFSLKDAFVRLKKGYFGVRAGHFKMPISAIETEGIWTLPLAKRDVLHDVLGDDMGIVGRRPGAQGELRLKGDLDLSADVGVFQGTDELGRVFDTETLDSPVVAGRVSISPFGVEVGAFGSFRPSETVPAGPEGVQRYWAAGLDVTWSKKLGRTGVRVWADGLVGDSWFDTDLSDAKTKPLFFSGRAIAAWRWGGMHDTEFYVEPYGLFGAIDPDGHIADDIVWEAAGGVNVGAWDYVRLTLEYEHLAASRNTPPLLFVADRDALLLQLGGHF